MPSKRTLYVIDSGSIHSLMAALTKPPKSWTDWDRRSAAEVTFTLLLRDRVVIPPPPKRGGNSQYGLVGGIYGTLGNFVGNLRPTAEQKQRARESVERQIRRKLPLVKEAFANYQADSSFTPWTHWHIENEWEHHVHRLGSLIDKPLLGPVSTLLGWSRPEAQSIQRATENFELVKFWSRNPGKAPQEIISGFAASSLLRGRYYFEVVRQFRSDSNYILHPGRNYIIDPVRNILGVQPMSDRQTELHLAGLLCAAAMRKAAGVDAVWSWGSNMRKIKDWQKTAAITSHDDPKKGLDEAIRIGKNLQLDIPTGRSAKSAEFILDVFRTVLALVSGRAYIDLTGDVPGGLAFSRIIEEGLRKLLSNPKSAIVTADQRNLAKEGVARFYALTTKPVG